MSIRVPYKDIKDMKMLGKKKRETKYKVTGAISWYLSLN